VILGTTKSTSLHETTLFDIFCIIIIGAGILAGGKRK